jgi:hypothetical protein
VLLAFFSQQGRDMSNGSEAAPKKALPPSVARTGASPGCVVATLLFCAGGGALFVTTVVGVAIAFAAYASSNAEQARRSEAEVRLDELRARLERDQERMRQRLEMPPMPEPMESAYHAGFPRHEFKRSDFPRGPRFESPNGPRGEAARPPLIVRPISVSYSRSAARPSRSQLRIEGDDANSSPDRTDERLERLQILSRSPESFAVEALWFAERRASLSDAMLAGVEKTIEEFILRGESPEAVLALPKVLVWYERSNLASLAKLILRAVELDNSGSPLPRRQILVGTFQRYRTLDKDWRDPAAGDVLRAVAQSTTISSHLVPSIEALHPPYARPVEDFLIEYSFEASCESMYAQRKALLDRSTCDRLLEAAIARLESIKEAERESAYVILAAAEPTPDRAGAVLDGIRSAFLNESVPPSPAAYAALARWVDSQHAADFREFCDCDCPIRRYAARAAVARFPVEADALAVSTVVAGD